MRSETKKSTEIHWHLAIKVARRVHASARNSGSAGGLGPLVGPPTRLGIVPDCIRRVWTCGEDARSCLGLQARELNWPVELRALGVLPVPAPMLLPLLLDATH